MDTQQVHPIFDTCTSGSSPIPAIDMIVDVSGGFFTSLETYFRLQQQSGRVEVYSAIFLLKLALMEMDHLYRKDDNIIGRWKMLQSLYLLSKNYSTHPMWKSSHDMWKSLYAEQLFTIAYSNRNLAMLDTAMGLMSEVYDAYGPSSKLKATLEASFRAGDRLRAMMEQDRVRRFYLPQTSE
eukprot:Opistho-2@42707